MRIPKWVAPALALAGAACTLVMFAVGVGVWKANVDMGTKTGQAAMAAANAALRAADAAQITAAAAASASDTLSQQVGEMRISTYGLRISMDRLSASLSAPMASRAWVQSIKEASDAEHRALAREDAELERRVGDLLEGQKKILERMDRLEQKVSGKRR